MTFHCLLCETSTWRRFVLCTAHREEYGVYNTWPPWLKTMAREEAARRYRQTNEVFEYSDLSLDGLLEVGGAGKWEFLATAAGGLEKLTEVHMDAIEAMSQLSHEELLILILAGVLGYRYEDIGKALGMSTSAAWSRSAKARKRLRELASKDAV